MKRALAILAVASVFGFAGFAQFSGEWDTNIHVLSPSSLDYTKLTINYEWSGWTFTSLSEFTEEGYSDQSFSGKGELGPVSIDGTMVFNPAATDTIEWECGEQTGSVVATGPVYKCASLAASVEFGGVIFSGKVEHWGWPYLLEEACCSYPTQTPSSYMRYTFTTKAAPVEAEVRFEDCCEGIEFYDASISLSGISLCCGITSDAELAFNKCKGFDYLEFTAKDLFPICCGISFDIDVKFTTTGKTLTVTPKMADIGEACFALYADLNWDEVHSTIGGLEVYGWKIRCDLAECNYIEILSALNVTEVEKILDEDVFKDDEFEYAKLGFCGPGCCGGNYSVDIAVYFGGGTLFDISRVGADMTIPVMSNFDVKVKFATPNSLDVGWTFTF